MSGLQKQMFRFFIVGMTCFLIDFCIFLTLSNVFYLHYLIAGFFGFTISVIVNYFLSMKYVFVRRDDLVRKKEFGIFVVLSLAGLLLNELILLICMDVFYGNLAWLQQWMSESVAKGLSKIGATGVVLVFNFISRKIFLEKKGSVV